MGGPVAGEHSAGVGEAVKREGDVQMATCIASDTVIVAAIASAGVAEGGKPVHRPRDW